MRTATRGRVHKSVLKPWARAPRRSSQSRRSICRALNRGLRPARPAPRSPRTPPRFHCLYHRLTLWRLTPSRREISAMIHFPAANMQAAWLRRCSNAAKSRRTRNLVGMPTLYAQRECLSLYYARFSKRPFDWDPDSDTDNGSDSLSLLRCGETAVPTAWPTIPAGSHPPRCARRKGGSFCRRAAHSGDRV